MTSNRVELVLIRPGLTSLEVLFVQTDFYEVNWLLMDPGKKKEIEENIILQLIKKILKLHYTPF